MNVIRKIFIGLLAFLLPITLAWLAWSHVVVSTVGNRGTLGSWLEESGAYEKITDVALDSASKDKEKQNDIPVDDPELRKIANQAFSPDFLRSNTDGFVNGIYDWLEGKTSAPTFQVDIASAKTRFADGIAGYVTNRSASLPRCKTTPTETDIWNATCLPAGVSAEQMGAQARDQILNSKDFLPNNTFNAGDIKVKDENGQPKSLSDSEQLKQIQDGYRWARRLPQILAVVALILGTGIVLLSADKRIGIKRVAKILIFAGIALGISYLFIDRGSLWLRNHPMTSDSAATRELAGNFIREVGKDISSLLLWYTLGYILLAIAILLGVKFINREPKPVEAVSKSENEDKPALKENKTTKSESPKN